VIASADELRIALEAVVGTMHVERPPAALLRRGGSARPAAWVVHPGSAPEVAELLALAHRHRAAVIPLGSGTRATPVRRSSVVVPVRPRIYLDSRRMCHVLHLDETSLVVHVQVGLTGLALERILAPRGLTLGDYPPSSLGSTIGGLLSVRTPGKSSTRHGFVEDAVLGVSAVLADGRTVHTRVAPRRASGPDLARVLCGSEGTLAFLTAAVLRIHRRPEARFLASHALPSFEDALAAVRLALREEAAPAALRVYDGAEARAHLGESVCGEAEAVLVVATSGPTDLAACDRDLVASATSALGGRPLGPEVAERWWRRRTGQEQAGTPAPPSMQVTAPPSRQAEVYRAVLASCAEARASARAHASRFAADGAVEFFTLTEPTGEVLTGERLAEVRTAAERAAAAAGAILLGSEYAEFADYAADLERRLDPEDILNPGA
jgi:alkyldihydroxyacetonephosphate synthase